MPALAKNKRAKFDYDFVEEYEGGLKLTGAEVKSAKLGHVNFKGAYLGMQGGELWLKSAYISPYKPAGKNQDYDPERPRKVLIKKSELKRLIGKTKEAGLTIVPISLYTKGDLVKLSFALARGKKKYEKRESIKKRELDRKIRQAEKTGRWEE